MSSSGGNAGNLPYFAVIAAIAGSGRSATLQLSLIVLFNLVFVAPLAAILVIRWAAGASGTVWLERRRDALERYAGEAVAALVLLIAVILVAVGTAGLLKS